MKVRIGTRRSRLALAQASEIGERLLALGVEGELVPIVTSGDRGVPAGQVPSGVKGLFVAEIVSALQRGEVDVAVHSAKDLPARDPDGVVVAAVPERADPFDVLVTRVPQLPDGAVIGTSSLRRRAQLLRSRPEMRVVALRGNVDTRLRRLEQGDVDGLVLASAGLARLGIAPRSAVPLPLDEMVPAPGQGALAVQARADDEAILGVVRRIDHPRARAAFEAERAVVARLGGDCSLPLGAYAESREGGVRLMAVVISPDGASRVWSQAEAETPASVAEEVSNTLLSGGGGAILASVGGGSP